MKKFYVTGDKHGKFDIYLELHQDPNAAVIILGDAGFNFYLNKTDTKLKTRISNESKCTWYVVRGNHEARPQDVPGMELIYDEVVDGMVYIENDSPRIRYFEDWGIYKFGSYRAAVIGGAYSIDKWYRLVNAGITQKIDPGYVDPRITGWFPNEQLSSDEKNLVNDMLLGQKVDFVLTHTCPISWEPTDLFLPMLDQSTVDKSTEIWLDELKSTFDWNIWLFGHYHRDRLERPHVEMYYQLYTELDEIWQRWVEYDNTKETPYLYPKSPFFYTKEQ